LLKFEAKFVYVCVYVHAPLTLLPKIEIYIWIWWDTI